MQLKIFPANKRNPGDHKRTNKEEWLSDIKYTIHKETKRKRPHKKNVVIFPIFSEFGSEVVLPLLCLPKIMRQKYSGKYIIVVGWHGREYLYRHLVDEFWELNEEHLNLREYCRCFHHDSKNLKQFELKLQEFGQVVNIHELSNLTIYPQLKECPTNVNGYLCKGEIIPTDNAQICCKCGVMYAPIGCFLNMNKAKKEVKWVPQPCEDKLKWAKSIIPKNAVGIVGRARKCYGRNLGADFYKRLIRLVQDLGYNPVWMGEKSMSLSCPCDDIFNFTNMPESKDLESTLAIVKYMSFTIQFWTASTRLAGLVGTPYLLFESPDQIWGIGHEGFRLNVCSKGNKKIVVSHFKQVLEDQVTALKDVKEAIYEMEEGNYRTKIGQIINEKYIRDLIVQNNMRVGFFNI